VLDELGLLALLEVGVAEDVVGEGEQVFEGELCDVGVLL
jgi:hypothetical protein